MDKIVRSVTPQLIWHLKQGEAEARSYSRDKIGFLLQELALVVIF